MTVGLPFISGVICYPYKSSYYGSQWWSSYYRGLFFLQYLFSYQKVIFTVHQCKPTETIYINSHVFIMLNIFSKTAIIRLRQLGQYSIHNISAVRDEIWWRHVSILGTHPGWYRCYTTMRTHVFNGNNRKMTKTYSKNICQTHAIKSFRVPT